MTPTKMTPTTNKEERKASSNKPSTTEAPVTPPDESMAGQEDPVDLRATTAKDTSTTAPENEPRAYEASVEDPVDYAAAPPPQVSSDSSDFPFELPKSTKAPKRGTLVLDRNEFAGSFGNSCTVPVPDPNDPGLFYAPKGEPVVKNEPEQKPPAIEEAATPPTDEDQEPAIEERATKKSRTDGWGNSFDHLLKDQWKCKACSTWNPETKQACLACEKSRADATGPESAPSAGAAAPAASGSIGPGGFTFGAAASSTVQATAAFGSALSSTTPAASGSVGPGGFAFSAAPFPFGAAPASTAPAAMASIGPGGFNFPAAQSSASTESKPEPDAKPSSGVASGVASAPISGTEQVHEKPMAVDEKPAEAHEVPTTADDDDDEEDNEE